MGIANVKKRDDSTVLQLALLKFVCAWALLSLVVMPIASAPQKLAPTVQAKWPYDPVTQPISLTELRKRVRSIGNSSTQHALLLERARRSHLAEYAAAEYRQQAAKYPHDPVLKSAFGMAVFLSAQVGYRPSSQSMREFYRSRALMLDAIADVDKAVAEEGENISFCWRVKGLSRTMPWSSRSYGVGSFGEGISAWRRAIELNPRYYANYTGLAFALLTKTSYYNATEAARLARKAAQLNPKSSTAYDLLASALLDLKRYEEAYSAVKTSFSLTPPSAKNAYSWAMLKVYKEKADEQRKAHGG